MSGGIVTRDVTETGVRSVTLSSCRDYLAVRVQIVGATPQSEYDEILYQGVSCAVRRDSYTN